MTRDATLASKLEDETTARHEPATAPLRPVAIGAITVAALTGAALIVSLWMFDASERAAPRGRELDHPLAAERELPPEPRLEMDPAAALLEQRRIEAERLGRYRWVDRSAGVVAIPIERAMELVAAEGLPVAPPPEKR